MTLAPDPGPGVAPTAGFPAHVLVALDASDPANRALTEALRLAGLGGGRVTGIHAYAARLHDRRFRQMEGGLPERYRSEEGIEAQRRVHDTLISRGLGIISDSYHEVAEGACVGAGIAYGRLSPEGKNYRRIVEAAAGGGFDLLAMGAQGLGAAPGTGLGSVCERVARRVAIDLLVIRDAARALGEGPIVAAVDGSPRGFGALRAALRLGRATGAPVHVVAAFDPYFHYVAFNRIAGVLSDEAGKVFRFREQEKLHEEIIDDGLAKIYRAHLNVAGRIAAAEGQEVTARLLDGKPHLAVAAYLAEVGASLLCIGRTGIHADPDLDIGGNAENLLRRAPCHVWLGAAAFTPPLDDLAAETVRWTEEAVARLDRVPEMARAMVRLAVNRFAQESGHTMVTCDLIEEATRKLCPHFQGSGARGGEDSEAGPGWSGAAAALAETAGDGAAVAAVRLRAEKRARREGAGAVLADHVRPFLLAGAPPRWATGALARLARVPELVRASLRERAEAEAAAAGAAEVDLARLEAVIEASRRTMGAMMRAGGHPAGAGGEG
ncbi:MAG: universal stress protein [Rhodobacteraceae bacterium]|nr:universal stress protein [Paracoccaceae bacterium]